MINGHATRPGDIHTSANGKTVEIDNTDAEGRLTLADALWYAQEKCGVSAVVDIATLTGACIIALGPGIAGLWSDDDGAAESVLTASKAAGKLMSGHSWRVALVLFAAPVQGSRSRSLLTGEVVHRDACMYVCMYVYIS